jgi:uncharacterized protein
LLQGQTKPLLTTSKAIRAVAKIKKAHPRRKTAVQTSPYVEVRSSGIHNQGVFAKKDIPKGKKLLEYIGRYVSKEESEKLADKHIDNHKNDNNHGAVYIFELNKYWDIDGNVSENTARLINHSCDPNCDAEFFGDHIWIVANQEIKQGEELSYDYGYDFEDWKDHPCRCGKNDCVGYIVAYEHVPKLKRKLRQLAKLGKLPKK